MGSINPMVPQAREEVVTGLKVLLDWVKVELDNLSSNIDPKSVCVKVWWFRSLYGCILLLKKHVLEGYLQWFLDLVSYLQFITDEIIDLETSQSSEIHESIFCLKGEQSAVMVFFSTSLPLVFAGPKESRESRDPL